MQEAVSDALDVGLLRYARGAHIGTGGFVETPNQRFQLRFVGTAVTPETLAKVPVTKPAGKPPLLLSDVADLVYAPQGMIGDAVINDGPGLMLIVEKFPWGNTLAVTRGVEEALERMKPGLPGVEIDTTIFRPATFVEDSIANLSWALLLGCVLVAGNHIHLPLRIAHRDRLHRRHSAVAARGGPRPVPGRRHASTQ